MRRYALTRVYIMNIYLVAIISPLITIGVISFFVFIFRTWIIKKIQYAVKHSYDKKLAEIETQKEIRHKAELIAELLAEWINKNEDKQKLNELTFKAFLWLPPEIASELSSTLTNKPDALDVRKIITKVREHLLNESDKLPDWKVIIFPVLEKKA